MLPRASATIRRSLCLAAVLTGACLLVLLQVLQLPAPIGKLGPESPGDPPPRDPAISGDGEQSDAVEDYSWMTKFNGPVPSVCQGPGSPCLERWLLSHGTHLAAGAGRGYRTPAIVHILASDPANRNPGRLGAFLLDWHRVHRNWTYVLWTGDEVQRLVRLFYRRYLPLVEGGSPQVLAHLVPLLIVQKYGGVMANADHRPTRSVDPLRRLPAMFPGRGRWPQQFTADPGLFLAAPGHAFLQYCTDQTLRNPMSHGGLTRLLLDYAAAFPTTERPESSLHLATLAAVSSSNLTGAGDYLQAGRLGILLRKCDQMSRINDRALMSIEPSWWPLGIGCSELREQHWFLESCSDAFVQGGRSDLGDIAIYQETLLRPEQLAAAFPLLNVGFQYAWKAYP